MGIFNSKKGNKKAKSEKTEKPSPEQLLFAEKAMEFIIPTFEKFGFKKHKIAIEKYSSLLIYRKENEYLKISSSTYPTDYPYCYNIIFGEGDSDDVVEYDWNSTSLWSFKETIEPKSKATEYEFPTKEGVEPSLKNANAELLKYGLTFLNGDLKLFHNIRKEQNQKREPYKIYSRDENGKFQTSYEPKSVKQKKKYS